MRLPDWPDRLAACVADRLLAPFSWGANDCAMLAFAAVDAVTGEDPGALYRDRYHDARGAAVILAELGGICALADRHFGPRVPCMCAQRGDIVLVPTAGEHGREALGVVMGEFALTPGPRHLERTPMAQWIAAWRVE